MPLRYPPYIDLEALACALGSREMAQREMHASTRARGGRMPTDQAVRLLKRQERERMDTLLQLRAFSRALSRKARDRTKKPVTSTAKPASPVLFESYAHYLLKAGKPAPHGRSA